MEDVFKFLLVIGIVIVGFVRQAKKEAKKNATNSPAMPIPEKENPLPENWGGGTYGGYIPEGPQQEDTVILQKAERQNLLKGKPATPKKNAPKRYTADSLQQKSAPIPTVEADEPSEFGFKSTEEARRAIIWSEILQRKY